MKENILYVIGMGPGCEEMMTREAMSALDASDLIVGYTVYLDQLGERYRDKEKFSTPMKQEKERCEEAFRQAAAGRKVAMICSGDAGVYGMASLMYEIGVSYPGITLKIIPGITAANSGAAMLGAPLNHDYCVISLSDLLTPKDKIEKRLRAAAAGDFAIALYNPSSKKRADYLQWACDILLEFMEEERPCGIVENIGRKGACMCVMTLKELRDTPVNMFTTVFIGNETTTVIDGHLVTKRGYRI